ncbi:MAG: hypothetical protein IIC66_01570 [candidate division Zixibacteria bacterium]|nr:hypothetical protein [candidate division Zixibacteria bacterium]
MKMQSRLDQLFFRPSLIAVFAVAMAYLEATVVVYLRKLYYPDGFSFPLKLIPESIIFIEIGREVATLVMLLSIAWIMAKWRWERFGWFLFVFGIWDIFYYFWLKVLVNWPSSILDWDVLFLVPLPWISPVIAPVMIALSMSVIGYWMIHITTSGHKYRPGAIGWSLGLFGTALILYSFMSDTGAILHHEIPKPYPYWLLALGISSYWIGFLVSIRRSIRAKSNAQS